MIAEGVGVGDEPAVLPAPFNQFNLFYDCVLGTENATPCFGLCHAVLPVEQWF
jgi:hypothetical protein